MYRFCTISKFCALTAVLSLIFIILQDVIVSRYSAIRRHSFSLLLPLPPRHSSLNANAPCCPLLLCGRGHPTTVPYTDRSGLYLLSSPIGPHLQPRRSPATPFERATTPPLFFLVPHASHCPSPPPSVRFPPHCQLLHPLFQFFDTFAVSTRCFPLQSPSELTILHYRFSQPHLRVGTLYSAFATAHPTFRSAQLHPTKSLPRFVARFKVSYARRLSGLRRGCRS